MTNEKDLQTQFSEIDLLTGCFNLVSFAKAIESNFGNDVLSPMTLIGIDVHQLRRVNRTHGFEYGDQLLRWLGIALRDEMGSAVYRISGEAFVVIMTGDSISEQDQRARNLFKRLNNQAQQLDLEAPVVTMAVIHFPKATPLNTALVWMNLNEAMDQINAGQPFMVFDAKFLQDDQAVIRAIELMAERIVSLGYMMNVTFRMAYTDPVGNLPNLIATRRKLDLTLAESNSAQEQFSLFLIDGDDLKRYNKISYAAGDELINKMSAALMSAIRPGDFVGRWRFGDEFIIILPNADLTEAVKIGDRIRSTIQEISNAWIYPITVSIGIVHYPQHAGTVNDLMEKAELALKAAKAAGKNRAVVAEL